MRNSNAVRRLARVLQVLSHLQSGVGLNASELAQRMDVCRRTVYRDLQLMRQAGLDIYFDDEQDCYRLSSECELVMLPSFSADDLATLIAAIDLSILADLPHISQSLRQSTSKILSRSPRPVRHSVSRLVNSFSIRTPFPDYPQRAIHVLHVVLQAIQRRRTLHVVLRQPTEHESAQTVFSPYRVVVSSDRWQVTGKSTWHAGICTLDPCEVQKARLTDETYAIPRQFQQSA